MEGVGKRGDCRFENSTWMRQATTDVKMINFVERQIFVFVTPKPEFEVTRAIFHRARLSRE